MYVYVDVKFFVLLVLVVQFHDGTLYHREHAQILLDKTHSLDWQEASMNDFKYMKEKVQVMETETSITKQDEDRSEMGSTPQIYQSRSKASRRRARRKAHRLVAK